jgi:hypothetical protein
MTKFNRFHNRCDLATTISGSASILKQGGKLLEIDPPHHSYSKDRSTELENTVYSKWFLNHPGLNENIIVTCAENGEHE